MISRFFHYLFEYYEQQETSLIIFVFSFILKLNTLYLSMTIIGEFDHHPIQSISVKSILQDRLGRVHEFCQ